MGVEDLTDEEVALIAKSEVPAEYAASGRRDRTLAAVSWRKERPDADS